MQSPISLNVNWSKWEGTAHSSKSFAALNVAHAHICILSFKLHLFACHSSCRSKMTAPAFKSTALLGLEQASGWVCSKPVTFVAEVLPFLCARRLLLSGDVLKKRAKGLCQLRARLCCTLVWQCWSTIWAENFRGTSKVSAGTWLKRAVLINWGAVLSGGDFSTLGAGSSLITARPGYPCSPLLIQGHFRMFSPWLMVWMLQV